MGAWAFFSLKRVAPLIIALAVGVVGTLLSGTVAVTYSERCYDHYRIRSAILRLLTADERASLHSEQLVCPSSYTFKRQGADACLSTAGGQVGVSTCG
jgi:hypothetical protein